MSPVSLGERVARVEQQLISLAEQDAKRLAQEEKRDKKIDALIAELGKYKGFIGGVLFVISCLWAFLKLGIPYVLKLMGKN